MMENAFAMERRPTLRERLGRRLGYTFRLGDEPAGGDDLPGWARTIVRTRFSWGDRLRLLITGRFDVELTHYLSAPVDYLVNRTDVRFPPPRWLE
jgi:hypothetical protein